MFSVILKGFLVSAGLIIAIGAQNAYVLKQGLLKQHIFWISLTCFLCDFVLMSFGVLGFGSVISKNPTIAMVLSLLGALFLFAYGVRAFISAYKGTGGFNLDGSPPNVSLKKTITTTLALTLLNPHVYIDTVVLIGGVAGTLSLTEKYYFLIGTLTASAVWFFGLGYGARLLTPLFKKPKTWQILDFLIGIIMCAIAVGLLKFAYQFLNATTP